MNPNERSPYPSTAQVNSLVGYMEKNPMLAKGFLRTASGRDNARILWEQLASQLNSTGGAIKTWKKWAKYWADKKSAVKKGMLRSAAMNRTGGGNELVVELSEVEERIIYLMGGAGFYEGDRHLGIQLIHQLQEEESLVIKIMDLPVQVSNDARPATSPGTVISTESRTLTVSIFDTRRHHRLESKLPPPEPDAVPSRPTSMLSPVRQSPSPMPSPSQRTLTTPRRTRRRLLASPPSQRRTHLSSLSERFLRVEEQRLEFDRRNARWSHKRDRMLESALTRMGENLSESIKSLAEAIKKQ